MEFKIRLVQKKKAARVANHEAAGAKRIKIRGRKRWVRPAKKEA